MGSFAPDIFPGRFHCQRAPYRVSERAARISAGNKTKHIRRVKCSPDPAHRFPLPCSRTFITILAILHPLLVCGRLYRNGRSGNPSLGEPLKLLRHFPALAYQPGRNCYNASTKGADSKKAVQTERLDSLMPVDRGFLLFQAPTYGGLKQSTNTFWVVPLYKAITGACVVLLHPPR